METDTMEQILDTYYADNAQKLHRMVDKILMKYGGLSDKDMDDFYSLANEVFVEAMAGYDKKQSFDGFLYSCLSNRIKTEITRRNRNKRRADRLSISLDMPVNKEEETTLGDMIVDSFDIEIEVLGRQEDTYSDKMRLYLGKLSQTQKDMLKLISAGYTQSEIQEELHISEKDFANGNMAIHSYRNISVLF